MMKKISFMQNNSKNDGPNVIITCIINFIMQSLECLEQKLARQPVKNCTTSCY